MIAHPGRAWNALKCAMFRPYKRTQLPCLPYVLDIEPTTYCNFKCSMCHVSDKDFPKIHMSFDLFKSIIDSNPQLLKIKLQGMGEPLLCPDFYEMTAYARKKRVLVQTTTNGSLLLNHAERLAKADLLSIGVSLDGATKQTFESIRSNSCFEKVTKGVKELARALRVNRSRTRLRAWTVLQRANAAEVGELVRLSKSLGVNEHVFQVFVSSWGKKEWADMAENSTLADNDLKKAIKTAKQIAADIGLPVRFFYDNKYSFKRPCIWPWHSAYISANGSVVPCCILGDPRVKSLGNLKDNSFSKLWNREEYIAFRNSHIKQQIPAFCRNCYHE